MKNIPEGFWYLVGWGLFALLVSGALLLAKVAGVDFG